MLNIRGMSIVENFLTSVNRFGHGLTIKSVSGVEQSGIPDTIGWTKPLSSSYGDSIERPSPIKCFFLPTVVALGQLNRILATIGESF